MKHSFCNIPSWVRGLRRPFGHTLAPFLLLILGFAISCCGAYVSLPGKLQAYSVMFLILAFLFYACFMLITLPCVAYSIYLCIVFFRRQRKFLLPGILIAADAALAASWAFLLVRFLL